MRTVLRLCALILFAVPTDVFPQTPAPQTPSTTQVPKGQMPTLGRPTESNDVVPTLDFDEYFLGKWTFEWTMPDSALGPGGDFTGTTLIAAFSAAHDLIGGPV